GTGTASVADGDNDGTADDLIYTADTGSEASGGAGGSSGGPTAREQTHNTVIGAEASMAALSAGNDFVGAATEGLAMAGNAGADGVATYANMGGGSMNVETGSHVKTHTWNAILALGHKNEKKLSTTEYGAFFEYGKGNYTTYAEGDLRGDGSSSYTGGGILGKWQKNNGFYVEGSLRAGSIHDDAHNVLRDGAGNPYSYDTDATYWGAHIGVGREIKLNKTDVLDLYAKYFYNHRGSVSFDAGGHYDLGAVESSVLRVGTRYTVKQNDNINYYGGLAVEHEFCGRASGFADGVAIRGADISGTSVRGEIGAKFKPDEKSNVTLDLNLSGFAGKKEGLTGGLSAVFHI
ncbi:autotransporter outer membrane beta-barrel domain-containing protein, partial [Anaerovibrio sp.]|uniref:autotransporter outer membrane beta-barrel domain-containing protein n=1 Tax=Anaerovibrio sp. TaxID=1872532 RepID=UPI00388CF055